MTRDFNTAYQAMDDIAPEQWASALALLGDTPRDEQPVADRWELAQQLFEARDYTGAAKQLAAVVEQAPEHGAARLLLARSYYHSAQLRRAEEVLREIVERDPVDDYAHLMLGRTLQRQGRHVEAEQWLRMAAVFAGEHGTTEWTPVETR